MTTQQGIPAAAVSMRGPLNDDLVLRSGHSSLYNPDPAPIPAAKRNWGWFVTFIVWANDVQSLFGYTLAASQFLT